jgi:DNA-binding transcriptional ArsR family regulator
MDQFIYANSILPYQPAVYNVNGREEDLYDILLESSRNVSELLKSAAHPGRVQILALLLKGENNLSALVEGTGLSKNALVNHLGQLIDGRLVRRVGRGSYELTVDGEDLISSVATLYQNSAVREEERRERIRSRYTAGRRGEEMSERVISKPAVYQPCWISYTGAVAGALTALGMECDITDVGGYSGYAFLTNVIKGTLCPSGPTAFHMDTWIEIHKGTRDIGYDVAVWSSGEGYPSSEEGATPDDIARARKLFERVKNEVDSDKPVVLWGLPIPEYGIANGYKGNAYITSTFRRLIETDKPEEPVLYHELQAPGDLHAIFFKGPVEVDHEKAHEKALERAHRFASGMVPVNDNYITGPEAFEEWAGVLENATYDQHGYQGNSYVAACLWEARELATEFLKRTAQKFDGARSKNLMEASKVYAEVARHLKTFTEVFPFGMEGEMPAEKRIEGASLLRKAKDVEIGAIAILKKTLDEW